MGLQLKIFQVRCGDAIRICYGDSMDYNIFIDAGYLKSYLKTIKKEINELKSTSKIHLWILTHIDRDHINGAIAFLNDGSFNHKDILQDMWFNLASGVPISSTSDKIGFAEGIKVRDKLLELSISVDENISNERGFHELGGAKITVLSPNAIGLDNLKTTWIEEEAESDFTASKENDYSAIIEDLAKLPDEKENNADIANHSSIAFLFDYQSVRILFLGDAHSSVIVESLQNPKLGYSAEKPCKVDYVKLAHHGSKWNYEHSLLNIIDCSNFIISANGGGTYNLPNKIVLAKILCHPKRNLKKQISFIFNYDNRTLKSIFAVDEDAMTKYNFRCLYPEAEQNAYIIDLDC